MIFEGTKINFFGLGLTRAGNSMPNVTLLIPIADVLDITVTELLQGEKLKENKTLNSDVVETLVVNSLDLSLCDTIRQRKRTGYLHFLSQSVW